MAGGVPRVVVLISHQMGGYHAQFDNAGRGRYRGLLSSSAAGFDGNHVTIIDDPATPVNELLSMSFSQISADGNRYIASGSFTVTGVFDDSSDFSSPLATLVSASSSNTTGSANSTIK